MIYSIAKDRKFSELEAFREASAEDLRVLLCLVELGSAEEETLVLRAGCPLDTVKASLAFWRGAGAVKRGGSTKEAQSAQEPKVVPVQKERSVYRADELADRIERYKLASIISACEQLYGKQLGRVETDVLVYCTEELGLGGDYLLTLLSYCKEKEKTSFRYMEKVAMELYGKDITTVTALEAYMEEERARRCATSMVMRIFGVAHRAPTTKEKEHIVRWIAEFGFGEEMIRHAYDITANMTGKASFAYADKILAKWHENGCRTVAQAEEYAARERTAKGIAPKKGKQTVAPAAMSFNPEEAWEKALKRSYGDGE